MDADEQRTIWCGNLSDKVTEEILYELFLQAGPVRRVKIPKDKEGRQLSYGFVTFKHVESVPYAITLMEGIPLFDRKLNLKPRQRQDQSMDRSPMGAMTNQIYNATDIVSLRNSINRGGNYNNYGHGDNYGGNNTRHELRGKGYNNSGGRYNSPNNKPYSHHRNDRNRRNRH